MSSFWNCYHFLSPILMFCFGSTDSMFSLMLSRCWLGGRKGIWPVNNWVVGCWHGYLSGVRCRFAYGPVDATVTHYLLLQYIQIGFTFLVLPFWYRLTRVVPDIIHKSRKVYVHECVYACMRACMRFCISRPVIENFPSVYLFVHSFIYSKPQIHSKSVSKPICFSLLLTTTSG